MTFDKIQFMFFTALTGFIVGFLATYFGIKISKFILFFGIILLIAFYVFVNGNFELSWNSIYETLTSKKDLLGDGISSIRSLLMRNIPLTIGATLGVLYGFKKA